ncbi:hypothetical protein AX17_001516 [Amanita inopinata Kibby_2008]|nr:hypothetical protein AX17_001516 [Amanita inopinata Kibby_2008]
MSVVICRLPRPLLYLIVRATVWTLRIISTTINALFTRLDQSPGIPILNPSIPYWTIPPSPISDYGSDGSVKLPEHADIVIIGSGMTGTSFARTVLGYSAVNNQDRLLKVVMLEARGACSGATGRNGGHITPVLYPHYSELKEQYGAEVAKEIIRFRLAHLPQILKVAVEENLLEDSQCREVEAFDVFHDADLYSRAKEMLSEYQKDLRDEGPKFKVHERSEAMKFLQLHEKTVGCLSAYGGSIHPYRFVTGVLARLLALYPQNFHLLTHTPCTDIKSSPEGLYQVCTSKGTVEARHIIHATNAWSSHLLPGMRRRIIPSRGVMSAQTSHTAQEQSSGSAHSGDSARSFVFYPENSMTCFDYLTQQRRCLADERSPYPPPEGELMLGGGFARNNAYLTELGNVDDRSWDLNTAEYLSGALANYFEARDGNGGAGCVKATWSGILGLSVDDMPWVGRVPEIVSGRRMPGVAEKDGTSLARPGEWIAAGYSGEGMVHAWLSGESLARMVVGEDRECRLPDVFRMSEERWRRTGIEDMILSFVRS